MNPETIPMASTQPKLRGDLNFSRQESKRGDQLFVLKDPLSGQFYRFREAEHFVAQQLDGDTPVDLVHRRAEEKFGAPLPTGSLESFIDSLRRSGLLESGNGKARRRRRPGRIQGSLFYLRIKTFDPDRLLSWLHRRLGFLFTPYFAALSAILIGAAALLTVFGWEDIEQGFVRLLRAPSLLLAGATIVLVGMAHEIAHGLTCKHFGGQVHDMGFMLLYFCPALYCDVSDAWLFPETYKRLLVTFSGAFFELFIWALATLAWRFSDPETALNWFAMVVMATSGIKTLFNFNPLIKLDGYYLLSDSLEIPNLRKRSFRHLGSAVLKLLGRPGGGDREPTPRERRIFLVYGLMAAVFSIALLIFVAHRLGGFLIGHLQALGLVLFLFLMSPRIRSRISRFFPGRRPSRTPIEEHPPPESSEAPSDRSRGSIAWSRRPAIILASLGALLAILFFGSMELRVAGDFRVLPSRFSQVRSEVDGIIEEILTGEGAPVRAGDPIVRLSGRESKAELEMIGAEILQMQARLRLLREGPRREEIELADREVEIARSRLEHARSLRREAERLRGEKISGAEAAVAASREVLNFALSNRTRSEALLERGLISRREFEAVEEQSSLRRKELEEAQAELRLAEADSLAEFDKDLAIAEKELERAEGKQRLLLAGSRSEEIAAAEAEIARAEVQRRYLEEQLDRLSVTSPIDGVICTPTRQLRNLLGQSVRKGDLVAEVNELAIVGVEIAVPEREIAEVKVGQRVILKARAYPRLEFRGEVKAIGTTVRGEGQGGLPGDGIHSMAAGALPGAPGKTVMVSLQIENSGLLLKPNMSGKAKIYCGEHSLFQIVVRRIERTFGVEVWSWW